MNPNSDKAEHALKLNEQDNRPDLALVIETAEWYQLNKQAAARIVQQTLEHTGQWRDIARSRGIAAADIELSAAAFTAGTS